MANYHWDYLKNEKLIRERKISFEDIIDRIQEGDLLDVISGKNDYRHQEQLIVRVGQYVYVVPSVRTGDEIFLKTIIPSRKMTKRYLTQFRH